MNKKLVNGIEHVRLGDILTSKQLHDVIQILRATPEEASKVQKLRVYLEQFRAALESEGYAPEYLALALPYWLEAATNEQLTQEFLRDKCN